MHHTSEPQNQGDRLKGWGIQYQPNITNYVTQTDPCCVGLLHETAALEDITKTIQQTANKEGAVICAHWSVRKTRRHIWYEDENGLGIVSYRPVGIRVGIQQCSLFNIPTRKDNTDGAGHTKLIRTIDAQKCSWKPIIGLMCFGCKRWWYVIPAETKACHLVYMESFFVSTASSSFSLLHVSLSLQLTISVLLLFEEAAWVPIRGESSGVEMEVVTVQDSDTGLSPLVDFTAGPLAFFPLSHKHMLSTQRQRSKRPTEGCFKERKTCIFTIKASQRLRSHDS